MDHSDNRMPSWLTADVHKVMALFVDGDFEGLEKLSQGRRLSTAEMQREIDDYGRTLACPPEQHFKHVYVVEIDVNEPAYFVRLPFFTIEEGRSDLEVQLTIFAYPRGPGGSEPRIEIENVLVT